MGSNPRWTPEKVFTKKRSRDRLYYYRFSLKGFNQAFERTGQLCAARSGQKQKSAPSEPKSKAPQKNDSEFFDAVKSGKSDKDFF